MAPEGGFARPSYPEHAKPGRDGRARERGPDGDAAIRVIVVDDGRGDVADSVVRAVVRAAGERVVIGRVPGDGGGSDLPRAAPESVVVSQLSDADLRLWRLVASGRYDTEIAGELYVSERTVKRRVASLLERLGVQRRIEAATLAGRAGILDGD